MIHIKVQTLVKRIGSPAACQGIRQALGDQVQWLYMFPKVVGEQMADYLVVGSPRQILDFPLHKDVIEASRLEFKRKRADKAAKAAARWKAGAGD